MNLYDAIFDKRIVKNFDMRVIDKRVITQILTYADYISTYPENIKISYEIWSCTGERGDISNHFTVKAPYYFVISTEKIDEEIVNMGLVLEQVSLYLETKGIKSCFAGFCHPIGKNKQAGVLAFGYSNSKSKSLNGFLKSKPIDTVCVFKDNAVLHARKIIMAAIHVPFRQNCQPWRFVVIKNRIHVFCRKDLFLSKFKSLEYCKQFDMGIMLAHLMIASEEMWYNVEITKNEMIAEKPLKKNIYMFTAVLTEQGNKTK